MMRHVLTLLIGVLIAVSAHPTSTRAQLVKAADLTIALRSCKFMSASVITSVPRSIDLANDAIAREVVKMSAEFGSKNCQHAQGFVHVSVNVWYKNDCDVTIMKEGCSNQYNRTTNLYNTPAIEATQWSAERGWFVFNNYAARRKSEEDRQAAIREADRRNQIAAAEAQKRREQEQQDARTRQKKLLDDFVAKHGVKTMPPANRLIANPFNFENETVLLQLRFLQMMQATEAFFATSSADRPSIYVTDIPSRTFSETGDVVLAAKVVGTKQVKIPALGETTVPHLKFVGVHVCRQSGCSEILPGR